MKVYAINKPHGSEEDIRTQTVEDSPSAKHQEEQHLNKPDDVVDNSVLATYIESLKMFSKESKGMDKTLFDAISSLPAPDTVKTHMGFEEARVLQESVNWLWEKITGSKMMDELKITHATKNMLGNYWILRNGVVLEGINHLTIIRNNLSLMSILLNLDQIAILGNMSDPNKCIHMAISNGAIRAFVNSNKEAFFQMSSSTYGEWGRDKIKKLDLPQKTIKIVDLAQAYEGWETGIVVKI